MSKVQVARLHSLTGHAGPVYTIQPSSSAHTIFSAGGDGMVAMWDLREPENGTLIARLPNSIYALHYHSPSDMIIAGHNYEGIHLLDWKNKKEIGSLQITKAAIFDIRAHDGKLLVASGDGMLTRVDMQGLTIMERVHISANNVRCISINETSGDVAVGCSDHFIRVYDASLALKKEWKAHMNSVFTVRYSPDGSSLLSGSRDARLKAWDARGDYAQTSEVVAHLYAINHLDFSPDGKHFVTCSMDKSIKVWDLGELKLLKVIDKARHAGHGTSVNKVLWTAFNDQLVSASDDRTLSVWKIIF